MNLFLHCLHFSHLQSTLHLMQYIYRNVFLHCSKQFLNLSILMLFSASDIFCFTSSTLAKCFPLRTFFIQKTNKKMSLGARSSEKWGWGTGVMPCFLKNCWTPSAVWAGALINHPTWNGKNTLKESSKKFTEAEWSLSQQRQLVHWYGWVPRSYLPLGTLLLN